MRCEEVMFFRPVTQALLSPPGVLDAVDRRIADSPPADGTPVVALLDGVPLERHRFLDGRIRFEDPDALGDSYRVGDHLHGTAMASLIIHGDLSEQQPALSRPIYVRPVMQAEDDGFGGRREQVPTDRLFLDVFHRAVQRMVTGEGGTPPTAPTVRIVNVSLGNPWQPFVREISPLARLLDWLAAQHNLLFLVSAGNYVDRVKLAVSRDEYRQLDDQGAVRAAIRSMRDARHERRLLSPAESINAVTIGALHADASGDGTPGHRVDLMRRRAYASPMSRLGLGVHRAVKPEILMPGGRQLYSGRIGSLSDPSEFDVARSTLAPGQLVASPSSRLGGLSGSAHQCGTSNATALATRLAALIHENLEAVLADASSPPDRELLPVLIKTLLVHASAWSDPEGLISELADSVETWQEGRRLRAQLMGFGPVIPERALVANDQRVLLVGAGRLRDGEAHKYALPIPDVMSGQIWRRRLVGTIAWFSPLHFRHRGYRGAKLYLSAPSAPHLFGSTTDADEKLANHGTVQHLIRESEERRVLDEASALELQVNCKADAGKITTSVPYGFAVTLEVAAPLSISIYQAIHDRLQARVPVRPR